MSLFDRFEDAIADLRSRVVISDEGYEQLTALARSRAFSVASLQQARMIQIVLDSLVGALERGEGLGDWRRGLPQKLREAWGKGSAYRLETIFRNNIQSALNRGRYKQMIHPTVRRFRPYWIYDAVLDNRTSPTCKERDRMVLPNDDPWWDSNYPPLHHRCRSVVRTLSKRRAERMGISTTEDIESAPQPGFGASPAAPETPLDTSTLDPDLRAIHEGRST